MLRVAFDRGLITNIRALIATHSSVEKMVLAHAACQRVQLTPRALLLYGSDEDVERALGGGRAAGTYAYSSARYNSHGSDVLVLRGQARDEISAELQNPYGYDISDVGMGAINSRLQRELAQSTLLYNQYDTPIDATSGNAMDNAIDAGDAIKLGLPPASATGRTTRSSGRPRGSAAEEPHAGRAARGVNLCVMLNSLLLLRCRGLVGAHVLRYIVTEHLWLNCPYCYCAIEEDGTVELVCRHTRQPQQKAKLALHANTVASDAATHISSIRRQRASAKATSSLRRRPSCSYRELHPR